MTATTNEREGQVMLNAFFLADTDALLLTVIVQSSRRNSKHFGLMCILKVCNVRASVNAIRSSSCWTSVGGRIACRCDGDYMRHNSDKNNASSMRVLVKMPPDSQEILPLRRNLYETSSDDRLTLS